MSNSTPTTNIKSDLVLTNYTVNDTPTAPKLVFKNKNGNSGPEILYNDEGSLHFSSCSQFAIGDNKINLEDDGGNFNVYVNGDFTLLSNTGLALNTNSYDGNTYSYDSNVRVEPGQTTDINNEKHDVFAFKNRIQLNNDNITDGPTICGTVETKSENNNTIINKYVSIPSGKIRIGDRIGSASSWSNAYADLEYIGTGETYLKINSNVQLAANSAQVVLSPDLYDKLDKDSHYLRIGTPVQIQGGPLLSKAGSGANSYLKIGGATTVYGDLVTESGGNIKSDGNLVLNMNSSSSQTISGKMSSKTSGGADEAGIEFSGDAQFNIKDSNNNNVKVRISDLYDPSANIAQMANVISALCRRVYTLEHFTAKQSGEGVAPPNHGEVQDIVDQAWNGDKWWIRYFAEQNLDSDNAPYSSKPSTY